MTRLALLTCFLAVLAPAQTPDFWKQLTPEERKAAGVDQLTPEQQAALDTAVGRFVHAGARREVEQVQAKANADKADAVRLAQEKARAEGVAAAREEARVAREQAQAEAKRRKVADAGLATRSDDEVIRSRIAGDFDGWEGDTRFTLENGQVWQQTDRDKRFFPRRKNPEVELVPSTLFGWKMNLVAEGLWIRVKRIK